MSTAVLVTRYADNRFTAHALALSDVVTTGASEAEAITALHATLADLQARSHIVQVDLPVPAAPTDDPWLRAAEIWADDPSWEAFQQAITAYRTAVDEWLAA